MANATPVKHLPSTHHPAGALDPLRVNAGSSKRKEVTVMLRKLPTVAAVSAGEHGGLEDEVITTVVVAPAGAATVGTESGAGSAAADGAGATPASMAGGVYQGASSVRAVGSQDRGRQRGVGVAVGQDDGRTAAGAGVVRGSVGAPPSSVTRVERPHRPRRPVPPEREEPIRRVGGGWIFILDPK